MRTLCAALGAVFALFATSASAQFPSKTVTIVVGYTPGGSNDRVARHIAEGLTKLWGKQVLVENRPGAGGVIGSNHVAKAAPDGHTLLVGPVTLTMIQATGQKLPFDVEKDFAAVALLGTVPMVLTVGPHVGAKTLKDLVAMARTKPLTYGATGIGAIDQFAAELLNLRTGAKFTPVQYKGGTEAVRDVIGGHIDTYFGSLTQVAGQIRSNVITAVAQTGKARAAAAPDLPTFAEAGVEGVDVDQWWGILAPAGTPTEVVARINHDINTILSSEEARQFFAKDGATPTPISPAAFTAMIHDELERWRKVANEAGIKAE